MNRFYYVEEKDRMVELTGDDAHHLSRVLRLKPGDRVELCDGQGTAHLAEIVAVEKERSMCRLIEPLAAREPDIKVALAFSLPKGDKAELVLQKATELGACAFYPFVSERSVSRPNEARIRIKNERWQKIIRSAAAQSKRDILPKVLGVVDWAGLLALFPGFSRVVIFWENEKSRSVKDVLAGVAKGERVLLVVGPEGGFSEREVKEAVAAGAKPATLGPRILRAETAAMLVCALAFYESGNMEVRE